MRIHTRTRSSQGKSHMQSGQTLAIQSLAIEERHFYSRLAHKIYLQESVKIAICGMLSSPLCFTACRDYSQDLAINTCSLKPNDRKYRMQHEGLLWSVETLHKSSIERYKVRISEHQKTIKEAGTWFISWRVFSMCCITKKKRRAPERERERVFYSFQVLIGISIKLRGSYWKNMIPRHWGGGGRISWCSMRRI